MKRLILFGLMIFLALAVPVHASLTLTFNQTQNNVGQSIFNETFTSSNNQTFYVNLPKNITVSNAKLNLSGYISNTITNNTETYYNQEGCSNWYPPDFCMGSAIGWVEQDYSILNNIGMIGWGGQFYVYDSSGYWNISVYNYSSSSWKNILNISGPQAAWTTNSWNTTINSNFYGNTTNNLKINISFHTTSSTPEYQYGYVFYNVYLSNPYLDVSNDGDLQWNYSGTFNQSNNQTSDFSSEINSYLKNCYPYSDGTCDVPFILHSDSAGIMQVQLNATITYDAEIFDNPVYEGQTSNFWVKVNSTSDISNVNAWLVYNGTSYAYTTKQQNGSYWIFTRALTIPSVNTDSNMSFYWNFTYTNATSTYAQNFSSNNQTVYRLSISNCTSGNITLNFTGYDEISKALMNYQIDATFTYWPPGMPFTKNFSYSYSGNNTYYVCIYPSNTIIYANAIINYYNSSYSSRYYYLSNALLINSTQNINLYLLSNASSTLITLNVLDQLSNPQSGVLVLIQKQNLGNGTNIQVAEGLTDYQGKTYVNLMFGSSYTFILIKNGVILNQYQPTQLQANSLTFYTSSSSLPEYFSYINNVATSCLYNNVTPSLTCTYVDTSGLNMNMTMIVIQQTLAGDVQYCSNISSSASGTLICNLQPNSSFRYTLTGTYYSSPRDFLWQSGFISPSTASNMFGSVGLLLAFMLSALLPLMGIYDVRIAVILNGLGIIFSLWMGLIFGGASTSALILLIAVISGVITWKIKT